MGWARAFLINNPELIRDVLVTRGKQFRKERRALDALRRSTARGWSLPKVISGCGSGGSCSPPSTCGGRESTPTSIVDRTERLLARWQPGQTVDIVEEMTHLTVEIIAKVFYDTELTGKAARLGEAVRVLSQTFYNELTSPVKLPDRLPLPGKRRKRRAITTIDTLIRDIIRDAAPPARTVAISCRCCYWLLMRKAMAPACPTSRCAMRQ